MKTLFTVLLGFMTLPIAAWSDSPEFSCYVSIRDYTDGPFQCDLSSWTNVDSVLFQGTYQSNPGLVVILENTSCFYQLPTPPNPASGSDYNLALSLPSQGPTYFTFQTYPDEDPALGWSPAPLPGLNYTPEACGVLSDASGQSTIADFLSSKITSASERYQMDLYACSDGRNCHPKQEYIAALNSCGDIASLKPAIASAIQSLSSLPECACPAASR